MKKRKILITGGLGFLGKSLAYKLQENGNNDVLIMDNFESSKPDHYTKKAKVLRGDVRNKADWDMLPSVDYVFHFAAPSSIISFNKAPKESIKTTLDGMTHCIEWAIRNSIKKLIYPSSGSVYGSIQDTCSEDGQVMPLNLYGKTKLECERIAQKYAANIPLLGLRIFAGFGPQEDQKGELASVITLFMKKLLEKQAPIVYGDGSQTRDFIYIDDIVTVLCKVMDNPTVGVLNVGSGQETSFNEVLSILQETLGITIPTHYVDPPKNYIYSTHANVSKLKALLPNPLSVQEAISRMIKC